MMKLILGHGKVYETPTGVRCSPVSPHTWLSSPFISVDILPGVEPDVVHDLMQLPWPFEDDQFDEIIDTCGHLGPLAFRGYAQALPEIRRIVKSGGRLRGWDKSSSKAMDLIIVK